MESPYSVSVDSSGAIFNSGAFEVEEEFIISNVPTLSQWGMIAMAGVLGIIGFMVMRRKVTV